MRKLLVALFVVLIIGTGIIGVTQNDEPSEIVNENNHSTTIKS